MDKDAEYLIRKAGATLLHAWGILYRTEIDVSGGYTAQSTRVVRIDDSTSAHIDFTIRLTINDIKFLEKGGGND